MVKTQFAWFLAVSLHEVVTCTPDTNSLPGSAQTLVTVNDRVIQGINMNYEPREARI